MIQSTVGTNKVPTNEQSIGVIEPDDDAESGYDTDSTLESATTSLASSMQEWMMENGKDPILSLGSAKG